MKRKWIFRFRILNRTIALIGLFVACSGSKTEKSEAPKEQVTENLTTENREEDLSVNETDFYKVVNNANYDKDFVQDYGADTKFATDDSADLQKAIDDISNNGGGALTIPAGNYSFHEIDLKSNVHLEFDEHAVVRPSQMPNQKNYTIFNFGDSSPVVKNTSITSTKGHRFKIDLTHANNLNVTVFRMKNVNNFLLADFFVEDIYSRFSAVATGISKFKGEYSFPVNGIIKNAHINNAAYGYGLVQTQAGRNIFFKDLSGTGGVTLRWETGYTKMNNLQVGGLDNMLGRNISCTNGNSTVMISPHAMHNGSVDVQGVTAVSCGFAVRIGSGFVSKKYDQNIGLTLGSFKSVRIKDVQATYGNKAQLKTKHIKPYMPQELKNAVADDSKDDSPQVKVGPSIAAIVNDANYNCDGTKKVVKLEAPLNANGFEYQPSLVVPVENMQINCLN